MILNVNVGILGHVDSGKTSLSKALSTVASTAAFDKNPQSQKRGITLDLGFSSFTVDGNIPSHLAPAEAIQVTLVDCPGHASLIRTIICGAHIIDLMLLVVDVNKGFQTQTAECLVIGELTCEALLVVLNKIDLILPEKRDERISKMKVRIAKTLESTKFKNAPIVALSAVQSDRLAEGDFSRGMEELVEALLSVLPDPRPRCKYLSSLPFLFAVDHCFSVSGQGTVLTGTVLRGCVRTNETVEIPQYKLKKKIKSMQMFRKPIDAIHPGDRAGICIAQLDSSLMERGFLAAPDSLATCQACLLSEVRKIAYFKGPVRSKSRFHVSIGQDTVLARITCLRLIGGCQQQGQTKEEFEYAEELSDEGEEVGQTNLLLEFDTPVVSPISGLVIGSRLDTDPLSPSCRLAFHGSVLRVYSSAEEFRTTLSVYRHKSRRGEVERVTDPRSCIVRGLFKRETNWDIFTGLKVDICSPDNSVSVPGIVEGSNLPENIVNQFGGKSGKRSAKANDGSQSSERGQQLQVILNFKKHVFDATKRFVQ
ncbi:unnamed protein product [Mesocestoides corti]|uniref:Selenocysteine-specific elongation factor n=1 Tax=Mesocestoides corti TaxID=53468 RepID=A0A0R3U9D7_MESCO|nr:unnamed protein product [Mesocestoides corti]